jgi:hypothetical protein
MAMFFSPYLLREAKEGKGEKNPLRGTQRKNVYIYVYVKITEAQRKEGRDKNGSRRYEKKKVKKEGRENRKENGRKAERKKVKNVYIYV